MNRRTAYINRCIPLLVMEPFRFLNRDYKEGQIIDRRRVDIRQRRVQQFIKEGKVVLCCDCKEEVFEKYGLVYDPKRSRYPVMTKERYEKLMEEKTKYQIKKINKSVSNITIGDKIIGRIEKEKEKDGEAYNFKVRAKVINNKPMNFKDIVKFAKKYHESRK